MYVSTVRGSSYQASGDEHQMLYPTSQTVLDEIKNGPDEDYDLEHKLRKMEAIVSR